MASDDARKTASGNLHRASFNDICLWVKHSWKGISTDIIVESFKTYNISNDLDSGDINDDDDNDYDDDNINDYDNDHDNDNYDNDDITDNDFNINKDDIIKIIN